MGRRTAALAGDKGYRYPAIRAWLRRHGVRSVIPERADQVRQRGHRPGRKPHFDRAAYRRRSAIECTVDALNGARAVAPRDEKLAIRCRALVQLSMIRLLVRQQGARLTSDRTWLHTSGWAYTPFAPNVSTEVSI